MRSFDNSFRCTATNNRGRELKKSLPVDILLPAGVGLKGGYNLSENSSDVSSPIVFDVWIPRTSYSQAVVEPKSKVC